MSFDPHSINLERHVEIGEIIARDADLLTDRWSHRAMQEQSAAQAAHTRSCATNCRRFSVP